MRIGQEADLVVVAPATADLLAKAAHGLRRRPAHHHPADRALPGRVRARRCTPRCGSTPPPRPTSRRCGARGASCIEPADRAADRRRHRQGPAARAGRDLRGLPPTCWPARAVARRADLAGPARRGRPPAAPASPSTRCASSATAPRAGRATPWPGPPRPAAPTVTLVAANVALPDPAGVKVVRVEHGRRAARRGPEPPRPAADAVVMAAAAGRLPARRAARPRKIKKAERRLGRADRAGRRTPTSWPGWPPTAARPAAR